MKSMFSFAQGITPFYNPSDTMFFLEGEERAKFEGWKKKGYLIGVIVFLIGLGVIITGVLTTTPATHG